MCKKFAKRLYFPKVCYQIIFFHAVLLRFFPFADLPRLEVLKVRSVVIEFLEQVQRAFYNDLQQGTNIQKQCVFYDVI